MAYEKLKLVTAFMSGDIYLASINTKGIMSTTSRRVITEEVLASATEWFLQNKKNYIQYEGRNENEQPGLFFTSDPEKAKKIIEILKQNGAN
ncbi:hypothetical protein [Carnobacterium maltaromaticum]|uniref:DUF7446 family protein n=1 Tax=Carnobacterium maltaromaticum TaxID=2751 RepID=UPI0039BE36A6